MRLARNSRTEHKEHNNKNIVLIKFSTILKKVIFGRIFGDFSLEEFRIWLGMVWEEVRIGLTRLELHKPEYIHNINVLSSQIPLEDFFTEVKESERFLEVVAFKLGKLSLVSLSAEPTWEFARKFNEAGLIEIVGCLNDTYGYLCTPNQRNQGGYEARGYIPHFNLGEGTSVNYEESVINLIQFKLDELK